MKKIKLGSLAKDKITGFEGVITGRAEYLTGCNQYVLQPICNDKTNYPAGEWFDEGRIIVLRQKVSNKDVQADKNGCDYIAPIK